MKIVIAYSGGLDTTVAIRWLRKRYDCDVIAYCANLGQTDDLQRLAEGARIAGAKAVIIEDLRDRYLDGFAFRALRAGAAYEDRYLMAAPLGRPAIAEGLVRVARQEEADAVAHGATGKGNDNVRFYASIVALEPRLRVLTPAIDWEFRSRTEELQYAKAQALSLYGTTTTPYSVDVTLWGSSIECGPLDDISTAPSPDAYVITADPREATDVATEVCIRFVRGVPIAVDDRTCGPVELVEHLNVVGGAHGVGRIDIIENRLTGFKTRGVYEAPAASILHFAYAELERCVTDRDMLQFKRSVSQRYAELVYNGLWFSPLREALDRFVCAIAENVTGEITVRLFKGNIVVVSRKAARSLYDVNVATYDARDTFEHSAGKGFAYIWSLPLRIASQRERSGTDEVSAGHTSEHKNREAP